MDPIKVGCLCPPDGARHPDGDTVTLYDPLPFTKAVAMQKAVGLMVNDRATGDEPEAEEILASLTEGYVLYGIESWSLLDEKGKPLPVTRAAVQERLLTSLDDAMVVADEADALYAGVVMRPLLQRASRSSQATPTDESTSAPTGSQDEPPTPLKRSSTTTSRTDATATTSASPDGDSSSSPNSASAA